MTMMIFDAITVSGKLFISRILGKNILKISRGTTFAWHSINNWDEKSKLKNYLIEQRFGLFWWNHLSSFLSNQRRSSRCDINSKMLEELKRRNKVLQSTGKVIHYHWPIIILRRGPRQFSTVWNFMKESALLKIFFRFWMEIKKFL